MTRKYTVGPEAGSSTGPLESLSAVLSEDLAEPPTEETVERRESTVAAELHGLRLDKAVVAMAGEFSRNHLQSLIVAGHVRIDGLCQSSPSRKVLAGQRISVDLIPTQECRAFRPEPMALSVVFEDADVIVIDKPACLVVHPAPGNWSGTLLNGLLAHHADAATLPRAGIVHRLDKDTSGLMVVGKTLVAMTALTRQMAARDVRRIYQAVCHGHFEHPTLRIASPIGRDPRSRVRMAVLPSGGREARTDVERLAVRDDMAEGALSAVRCSLHTGRTHQIRVHMASVGHPLLADLMYGGRIAGGLTRQALHAARLGFSHPITGQPLAFEAPPPPDFATVWQVLMEAR